MSKYGRRVGQTYRLRRITSSARQASALRRPVQTKFIFKRTDTALTAEERRARWWKDKVELLRQNYVSKGKTVPSEDKLNRAVAKMWHIMSEWKKDGVLQGTYEYTGMGLAEGQY